MFREGKERKKKKRSKRVTQRVKWSKRGKLLTTTTKEKGGDLMSAMKSQMGENERNWWRSQNPEANTKQSWYPNKIGKTKKKKREVYFYSDFGERHNIRTTRGEAKRKRMGGVVFQINDQHLLNVIIVIEIRFSETLMSLLRSSEAGRRLFFFFVLPFFLFFKFDPLSSFFIFPFTKRNNNNNNNKVNDCRPPNTRLEPANGIENCLNIAKREKKKGDDTNMWWKKKRNPA